MSSHEEEMALDEQEVRAIEARIRQRVDEALKARGYGVTTASRRWLEEPISEVVSERVREFRARIRGEISSRPTASPLDALTGSRLVVRIAQLEAEVARLRIKVGEMERPRAARVCSEGDRNLYDAITVVHRQFSVWRP